MEWRDRGILLGVRKHGETSVIAEVFTQGKGRHAGIVRGGISRKMAPALQPGAEVDVTWRARLEDHLGTYTIEPLRSRSAEAMADRMALATLSSVAALLIFTLPEREAHLPLFDATGSVLDLLDQPDLLPLAYLRWERLLLEELGFGLDLSACAVTGTREGLIYVSPRSGRAVSAAGAGEWADKLLPLPAVLLGQGDGEDAEVLEALRVTGHFLTHRLAPQLGDRPLPEARARLIDRIAARVSRR